MNVVHSEQHSGVQNVIVNSVKARIKNYKKYMSQLITFSVQRTSNKIRVGEI